MLNTVLTSIKINNAYYTNTLIYRLKQLPFIGKKISKGLYSNEGLKVLVNLVVFLYQIISPFIGKFIYVFLLIYCPYTFFKTENSFIHIFVFLTIIGSFCNTDIFNPTKSKYYSVILMRTDAKKYVLSSLFYFLLKLFLSFYPALFVAGLLVKVNPFILVLMPLMVVSMKLIGNVILLRYYEKKGKVLNENNILLAGTVSMIGLSLAYLFPYFGYSINTTSFLAIFLVVLVLGFIFLRYILKYKSYHILYKKMLNLNTVIFSATNTQTGNMQKQYSSRIENIEVTSNKKGYDYFNDIFIKRHGKILTKSAIKMAFIGLGILIATILGCLIDTSISEIVNKFLKNSLPYFVLVMYFVNRGSVVTQAMFINCDHSMLAYRFYRKPDVILNLFKRRLKSLIQINFIPTIVIALGLPILLAISGGTVHFYHYILLFGSIIFLSIFFSVHHLVMYYLLQPYDINMKSKSSIYSIVNAVTYFVCYMCIDFTSPMPIFASFILIFSLLYIAIALFLVNKYAPSRFKLKE